MILHFCSQELSAFFFDIRKDALYCDEKDSLVVQSTKTVMADVFQCLIRWLAPIIPFTSEEAWQCWRNDIKKENYLSCHLLNKIELSDDWNNELLEEEWTKILEIKNAFTFAVEKKETLKKLNLVLRLEYLFILKVKNIEKLWTHMI